MTMKQLTKPIPDDCRLTVKNLKVMESLSEETLCFSASVYLDGKRIGEARNHGHGGCNDYLRADGHRWNPSAGDPAYDYAAEVTGHDFEPLDSLLGDVIQEAQDMKVARRFARQGCTRVALVKKGHYVVEATHGEVPTGEGRTTEVALPAEDAYMEAGVCGLYTDEREEDGGVSAALANFEREGWQAYRWLHGPEFT